MLLADTSVLIAQFRNFDPKREALIRGQPVGLCGPVLAEFLAGARTVKHQASCQVILASLIPVATPEAESWRRCSPACDCSASRNNPGERRGVSPPVQPGMEVTTVGDLPKLLAGCE